MIGILVAICLYATGHWIAGTVAILLVVWGTVCD